MLKDSSVMNNLHKISGQIADASKHPGNVPENESSEPVEKTPPKNATLNKALLRRYEDLLHLRQDLAGRLSASAESLRLEQNSAAEKYNAAQEILNQMDGFLAKLQAETSDFDPGDQTRLSSECRETEQIRLESIRLLARAGKSVSESPCAQKQGQGASFLPELTSLSFPQLARLGLFFFFPVIAALVLLSLLICIAIIGAFNGALVW